MSLPAVNETWRPSCNRNGTVYARFAEPCDRAWRSRKVLIVVRSRQLTIT